MKARDYAGEPCGPEGMDAALPAPPLSPDPRDYDPSAAHFGIGPTSRGEFWFAALLLLLLLLVLGWAGTGSPVLAYCRGAR